MKITQLLVQMGFSAASGVKGLREVVQGRRQRLSPKAEEQMRFAQDVRAQFVKLKEKGLSIPVFTL